MKYVKPTIEPLAEAVRAIQSAKMGGVFDIIEPTNPEHSVSAYEADE